MIIQFDNNSYIEIKKNNNKIIISIAAVDIDNPRSAVVNSAEITLKQFEELTKNIIKPLKPKRKKTTKKKKRTSSKKKTITTKKNKPSDGYN